MTITLPGLLILIVIAAVCGAIGKAIAGGVRGGLIVSTALGFIGAAIGPWVAGKLGLSEPLMVQIGGHPFPGAVVDHRRGDLRRDHSPGFETLGGRLTLETGLRKT